jgi:hypothetical protein
MTRQLIASLGLVGILVAVVFLTPEFVVAQVSSTPAAAKTTRAAKTYIAPRTPDGQPDLQGYWSNTSYTPLERPNGVNKEFYSKDEAEEIIKRAAANESEQTEPGTIPDVHYDFTQFGLDRSQSALSTNLRTSLIVDPPNGKFPPLSAEGQSRAAERAAMRKQMGGPLDAAQNQSLSVRCINMDRNGPPMLAGAYNNNYQFIQGPGYVMILVEMLHDARIIPLGKRPQLTENLRQLEGSSRGHWEGETLVVETTNFTNKTAFQGSSEKMRLIERFTRVAEDTIRYQFTVEDPATWTRPWSAEVPWKKTVGPIFEHACHEGNYGLANSLAGARVEEKRAREAAK